MCARIYPLLSFNVRFKKIRYVSLSAITTSDVLPNYNDVTLCFYLTLRFSSWYRNQHCYCSRVGSPDPVLCKHMRAV
jgi:hypothetical protein